jgi:hypothetical protein
MEIGTIWKKALPRKSLLRFPLDDATLYSQIPALAFRAEADHSELCGFALRESQGAPSLDRQGKETHVQRQANFLAVGGMTDWFPPQRRQTWFWVSNAD